jgi:F0F1-type ATP synthase assembly protein I
MAFGERKTRHKPASGIENLVQAEKLLQIAFLLPSSMIVGWLLGAWGDSKLHQSWMTIAGLILGCIAGLFYVIRLAIDAEKGTASKDAQNGPREGAGRKQG